MNWLVRRLHESIRAAMRKHASGAIIQRTGCTERSCREPANNERDQGRGATHRREKEA